MTGHRTQDRERERTEAPVCVDGSITQPSSAWYPMKEEGKGRERERESKQYLAAAMHHPLTQETKSKKTKKKKGFIR
jgi:hypothetical protein